MERSAATGGTGTRFEIDPPDPHEFPFLTQPDADIGGLAPEHVRVRRRAHRLGLVAALVVGLVAAGLRLGGDALLDRLAQLPAFAPAPETGAGAAWPEPTTPDAQPSESAPAAAASSTPTTGTASATPTATSSASYVCTPTDRTRLTAVVSSLPGRDDDPSDDLPYGNASWCAIGPFWLTASPADVTARLRTALAAAGVGQLTTPEESSGWWNTVMTGRTKDGATVTVSTDMLDPADSASTDIQVLLDLTR